MKIATWNVNSIKARLEHVKRWLSENQPDLLLIQELKGLEFPADAFTDIGYHSEAVGQKAYNGVAILSKDPQKVISRTLDGDDKDEQARYIEIDYADIRVINIYLPNGNPVLNSSSSSDSIGGSDSVQQDPLVKPKDDGLSDKYIYKLNWMERLYNRLKTLREENIPFVIAGDFNVIPADEDCHNPTSWRGDALFRPETHAKWQALLNLGLYDAFRIFNNEAEQYSFWDYQAGAWHKNNGIRIDHFLLSPPLVERAIHCEIDKAPRGEEKASDHTPVILTLAD